MELSNSTLLHEVRFTKPQNSPTFKSTLICNDFETDLIDVNTIEFEDDESWLYPAPITTKRIRNLEGWLHNDLEFLNEDAPLNSTFQDYQKNFDSRTFTRPKKRFVRPSIEKYNEEVYGSNTKSENFPIKNNTVNEPLNFDLSQPSNSFYFDNMVANMGECDSFQNMSPPSLVNSMCSSTFANLMESSFIKNDPVLREIRDTDFTETVLLQDSEPPMFQSITESCSSLNSDTPEGFLKKVSRSDTFKINTSSNFDRTITIENSSQDKTLVDSEEISDVETGIDLPEKRDINKTFSRKEINAFRLHDKKDIAPLNSTFNVLQLEKLPECNDVKNNLNLTNNKKQEELPESVQINDLNRLGYYLVDDNIRLDSGYNESNDLNKTVSVKRSSISTGSADSLDRMSSLSNGSRESSKILNMADVDAIIEMQEKSEAFSDSDLSSNEEFKSVRSSLSKTSLDSYTAKPVKSLNYLKEVTTSSSTPKTATRPKSTYSNLKSVQSNIPGSQTNIYRPNNSKTTVTASNLKTMGTKLKGSYTSLRPISANLPVVPPPIKANLNTTRTLGKATVQSAVNYSRIEAGGVKSNLNEDATFVKPFVKPSCLPRPTGIPRPASKIPGPRSSSARLTKYNGSKSDSHNVQ